MIINYFRKKSKISEIQGRLSAFAESLRQCCHHAEPAFIMLGEELQRVHGDATELARKTVDTIKMMSGECEQERVLDRVASLAKDALSELRNRQENVKTNLSSSNAMIQHLSGLYAICGALEKVAVLLRIVGLNMDIESARYDEFTAIFGFVTREIRILSEKVSQTITHIENDSRIAYAKQSAACREIEQDLVALEELSVKC
ncbi:MAG: hypothetical protein HC887_12475 [Desulfobacteraceae bacterium]|nr:hypothetical protein [Desulfobacteraceae bacterium]